MKKEQKIDSILNSLEGIERSSPKPFFFGRVEARLQDNNNGIEKVISFISRPAVAVAAVFLIIVVNAWSIGSVTPEPEPIANQVSVNDLPSVDEYMQISSDNFDLDKQSP